MICCSERLTYFPVTMKYADESTCAAEKLQQDPHTPCTIFQVKQISLLPSAPSCTLHRYRPCTRFAQMHPLPIGPSANHATRPEHSWRDALLRMQGPWSQGTYGKGACHRPREFCRFSWQVVVDKPDLSLPPPRPSLASQGSQGHLHRQLCACITTPGDFLESRIVLQ